MFVLGQASSEFSRIRVPAFPKTTHSIGRIGGGTSVNSIPISGWMEVDMRSESLDELKRVEDRLLKIVNEAGGYKVSYDWSSTDSNLPMSLGIPALTIGRIAPDKGGRSHSTDEWIDVEKEPMVKAMASTLSIVLAVTGME